MYDNCLPLVAPLLHDRYREQRRQYLASIGYPWPERRSRKRKPIPGVYDVDEIEG